MSLAAVLLSDSGSSYNDDNFCETTLGTSSNDYDDLLEYTIVISGRIYKYAYFVRTWPSNANLYPVSSGGWGLSYVKCKFFAISMIAYWFFSDTTI
jgi:hypothetical protein